MLLCGVEAPAGRPAIAGLRAKVVTLRSAALMHPGPRLTEALGDLEAALDRASDSPARSPALSHAPSPDLSKAVSPGAAPDAGPRP